jgi:hypothetical protein
MFDKALAAAEKEGGKDAEFAQRLRRERLTLEHVWLKGYDKFKRYAQTKGKTFMGPNDPFEACKQFFDRCEKYNVTAYREYDTPRTFAAYRDGMLSRFGKPTPLPDEFSHLDPNTWIDVQEYDFRTINISGWVSIVNDSTASNSRAVRMPGNHAEWAATIPIKADEPLFENTAINAKYKVIVYARCDATAADGLAMTWGIYDQKERKSVTQKNLNISDIAGLKYQKIEFSPLSLTPSMIIWFAPPKRPDEVQAIYIDRVLIIKE